MSTSDKRAIVKPKANNKSYRNKIFAIIVSSIVLIGLIFGGVFFITQKKSEDGKSSVTITQLDRTVTGKSDDEDKKDAVASMTEVLRAADKSPTGITATERLSALDKADFSVLDESLIDLVHFAPSASEAYKINTYQTLITMAVIIKKGNPLGEIAPYSSDSWIKAHPDQAIGTVYVPMDVYADSGSYFSYQMVYVDSKWKLAPYSLVDSVRLSVAIQDQLQNQNPTSTSTP